MHLPSRIPLVDRPACAAHCQVMDFASRLTRTPFPFDPALGRDALAQYPDASGALADLICGAAGSSPYLAGLLGAHSAWLTDSFDNPEAAIASVLAIMAQTPTDRLGPALRQAKARIALLVALADLGGVWPLETVTATLTRLADAAVDVCLRQLVAAEIARGKLPGLRVDDAATAGGMVALAMGKMGADELNYSSDIDLICLFDETRFATADVPDARAAFVRITRRMTALLSDNTDQGYVFRTDLRLRPDASVTPVCLSMAAAESYYESVGRTWERAAYIKARACAGDIAAGEGFLTAMRPFVWRKHLDFAAIQDAHDMRLRIRDHRGLHGLLVLPGHNMKLGRGGIREIEFFTQTRQLIAGGRDASLRVRGTTDGLARLAAAGWVDAPSADTLTAHYRAHRQVEHRLQMIADQQTHDLPQTDAGFARLAALMGQSVAALQTDLTARLTEVDALTEGFFAPGVRALPPADDFGADVSARWLTYPALRSERAVQIFKRLRPELLRRLQDAAKPDEALAQFDGFLAGLPAGVQLFSLFDANPQLTQLIVDIAATAPALARYLSRNAGVFDAVIGGGFFADWPGVDGLVAAFDSAVGQVPEYEAMLVAARRWQKEWHFRVGVHHLRGLIDAELAGHQYADLAQAVLQGLWPQVLAQFASRHGAPPGQGAVVLGMGALGAGRLNAASDLDLIVIYDAEGAEGSTGPRPLPTRAYYAKLTQALITAITAPMAAGRLYAVDMRLRPSGQQGPVATAFAAFRDYQQTQAWTWEHLALTRARVIAGDARLGDAVEQFRTALLRAKSGGATVRADVADMRARIAQAKPAQGDWDAKIGPGRLQDIELAAQMLALQSAAPARDFRVQIGTRARDLAGQIGAGVASGQIDAAQAGALLDGARLFWQIHAAARLLMGDTLSPGDIGEGGRRFVLRETGQASVAGLIAEMARCGQTARDVIDWLLLVKGQDDDGRFN